MLFTVSSAQSSEMNGHCSGNGEVTKIMNPETEMGIQGGATQAVNHFKMGEFGERLCTGQSYAIYSCGLAAQCEHTLPRPTCDRRGGSQLLTFTMVPYFVAIVSPIENRRKGNAFYTGHDGT